MDKGGTEDMVSSIVGNYLLDQGLITAEQYKDLLREQAWTDRCCRGPDDTGRGRQGKQASGSDG